MNFTPIFQSLIHPGILWAVFFILLVGYGVMTTIILYHWKSYGITMRGIRKMKVVYFAVGGLLIILMLTSLLSW
jgi:hypothetical protein